MLVKSAFGAPKPDSEKQLDTKVQEELHTVNKEAKSKKRKHDVQNKSLLEDAAGSGPSVKKRRKSQRLEGNVKASEEDIVSKSVTGKLKQMAASIINENLCESRLESKDLSDENSRGENSSAPDQVATSVPSIVEDVQEETHSRKNTEAGETVPEVAMAVEKNIHQEMPFGISQMQKDVELVQRAAVDNEIPSSSMSHSKAAEPSTKPKAAEKEVSSTSFSKELHNINKDAMDSSHKDVGSRGQESAVNQMDKRKKDRGEGKKRKSKKTAVKSKDESLVKHADNFVGDISSTVPARVFDEKSIDERKNDKDTFSSAERNEVLEKTLIDDSFGYAAKKGDDFLVKEVEISEPTESMEERLRKQSKDTGGDIKTIEDVGRASLRIDEYIVKHTGDAATVTNEEKLPPHFERKESVEMAYIDALPVDHGRNDDIMMDNDVEVSRTENNAKGVNANSEKQNEKMDAGTKKTKTKKKAKKSAERSDNVAVVANEEKLLPQTEGNENREMASIDALHIDHVRNYNILMDNDVELSRTEKNVSQVNAGGVNDNLEKQNEKMDDGTKKNKKKKAKKSAGRSEDAAIVTTEEKLLPQTEGNENREMTSIDALHIDHVRNDNILMNNDVELSRTEKNVSQVNAGGVNDDLEKQNEKMDDGTKKKKKKAKKSAGRSEDAAIVTTEEKLLLSSDIPKDSSREIDFKHYFVPHHQPENNAPTDIGKDAKLPGREKKTEGPSFVETSHDLQQSLVVRDNKQTREQDDSRNDGAIQASLSRKENNKALLSSKNTSEVSNGVGKDQNTRNTDEVKSPKRTIKIDAIRAKKTVQASKGSSGPSPELSSMSESFGRSFPNKKSDQRQSTLGHSHLNTSKKSAPVVKNLLNTPGAIFGDDSDESSADDNATVGSDSSTRTPSRRSSSSGETDSDSSIDTRKNVVKRKDAYGKSTMNSQSMVKKSMSDLLRSSSRFKRARFSASQQADDTESQPVDFVPESQL